MSAPLTLRRCLTALLASFVAVWIVACGGGGGVGEGGTGSFSSGPITGFGSIIVNGVRFDDSSAVITDDDGATRQRGELRLGMVVAIDSTRIDDTSATASARSIRVGSDVRGIVTEVNAAQGSFKVFGLTVRVIADTVFDDGIAGGIAGLRVADVVEVYGFLNRARTEFVATRVERKPLGTTSFKLRGPLEAVGVGTITIGGQVVTTTGIPLPPGLAPGVVVRVRATLGAGGLAATRVDLAALQVPDRDDVRVEGRITSFTSTRSFSVDGVPVDAANAAFPDGEAGVVLGARVEVEGAVVAGVLRARKVEVEDASPEFRARGTITSFDGVARRFVVRDAGGRDVTVSYLPTVEVDNGAVADLRVGIAVDVRGLPFDDGTRLLARRIKIE